ncbi:MAG: hypothetical protein ACOC2W_00185 [bacterium]
MRINLRKYEGQRIKIRATIRNIGTNKKNKKQYCIELADTKDAIFNTPLTDHIWIRIGKQIVKDEPNISRGDVVEFMAKVKGYTKNKEIHDYGLFNITQFRIVNKDSKFNNIPFIKCELETYNIIATF